jgi:BirA family biotin operon repressor/biotin-[acetyl-CoA-carboxylase] ligase
LHQAPDVVGGARSVTPAGLPPMLLALAAGEPVSGASVAVASGVTRAAVCKQVEALRARGLPVLARGQAGYQLPRPLQLLDGAQIRAGLPVALAKQLGALEVHWELDSTSTELQRRAGEAPDLSIVLAETQAAGRGRRGRRWLSPPGMNLYLSCLKRFDHGFADLAGLSLAVGTMLLRALAMLEISGAGLKWPNDVLARGVGEQGGKLAGILVELGGDYQGACTAVIGVGLNLCLTPALRDQAGQPVCDLATLNGGAPPDRNRAAAALIAALVAGLRQFERDGFAGFRDDYARYDVLRDQALRVTGAFGTFAGVGAGVDDRGALRVRLADGSVRLVDSADVTVRRR